MAEKKFENGEFCWNELVTNDAEKAKSFYTKLLNWETNDVKMENFTYTILKKGDNDIAGLIQIPPEKQNNIPSHWMSYIRVEDLDEVLNKATSLGATIKQDKYHIPDYGTLAVIEDPLGAIVAFWKPEK